MSEAHVHKTFTEMIFSHVVSVLQYCGVLNPFPAEPGYTLLLQTDPDQLASQLIWICTVCHTVYEFISTIWIKLHDRLKIRSGRGILIYSAGQGLT